MAAPRGQQPKTSRKYEYSSLGEDDFSFRLLQLLPGRRGSPIRVRIDKFAFAEDAHPPYEALSYTWGNPIDKIAIIVSGGDVTWSLDVTQNCEEALRYLRFERRPRWLWVDAIFINQFDDAEKSDQVFHMIRIYRVASRVVAWLGPADATSHVAFNWMRTVSQNVTLRIRPDSLALVVGGDKRYLDRWGYALIISSDQRALALLLQKPEFTRLWVRQEVSSISNAILKCGGHVMSWQRFCTFIEYLRGKSLTMINRRSFFRVYDLCLVSSMGEVCNLMSAMRSADCLDPLDRIYVAEALALDQAKRTKPAYGQGWKRIYTAWTQNLMAQGNVDVLRYAGVSQSNARLPSWVPNWSVKDVQSPLGHFFAHGGAKSVCCTRGARYLDMLGVTMCKLHNVVAFRSPLKSMASSFTVASILSCADLSDWDL